jgi:hypothetical protein
MFELPDNQPKLTVLTKLLKNNFGAFGKLCRRMREKRKRIFG